MEYSIRQLSDLAGVSTRTLRYYDEIGLLAPVLTGETGCRYYGQEEVERLQQILFYRQRGMGLDKIRDILQEKDFDVLAALTGHLRELERQQEYISDLIQTVNLTISMMRGEIEMDDAKKFAAFKKRMVDDNEKQYGEEARELYGEDRVEESNAKMMNLSKEEYDRFEKLGKEILKGLQQAVSGHENPQGEMGRRLAEMHREWLEFTWQSYTTKAHAGLVEMYVADERFRKYYDSEVEGCAQFLRDAVKFWMK